MTKRIIAEHVDFFSEVKLDGGDVKGKIVGVACYPAMNDGVRMIYQVSYWCNGIHYEQWFEPERLLLL
jgi:hypothetical protein